MGLIYLIDIGERRLFSSENDGSEFSSLILYLLTQTHISKYRQDLDNLQIEKLHLFNTFWKCPNTITLYRERIL